MAAGDNYRAAKHSFYGTPHEVRDTLARLLSNENPDGTAFSSPLTDAVASVPAIKTNTATTQNLLSSLTFAQNKRLTLTANTPAGGISRLIELHMTTEFDRPWISWFDENSVHRAAFGYHSTDASEGGSHQAVELKTVAADGVDMRTRLSFGTMTDRILVGFNYTDTIEVNQGEVPGGNNSATVAQFGLKLRGYKRDGSGHGIISQLVTQTETTDGVTTFLDVVPLVLTAPAQLVLMRSTQSSSASTGIYVKRGDGTNTDAFTLLNRTGVIRVANAATVPSANVTSTVQVYATGGELIGRDASGNITKVAGAPSAVTGSRAGNAALAALLTALAARGLITDSTTA